MPLIVYQYLDNSPTPHYNRFSLYTVLSFMVFNLRPHIVIHGDRRFLICGSLIHLINDSRILLDD